MSVGEFCRRVGTLNVGPFDFAPLLSLSCANSFAEQGHAPDITLHSTVSGSGEQPKVMYILPWQQPSDTFFEQDSIARSEGDLFEPLDRDEFIRELNHQAAVDEASAGGVRQHLKNLSNTE